MSINTEIINIYKNVSVSRQYKGSHMLLHALEPIGLEITSPTNISILISGINVMGSVSLYIHDSGNIRYIQDVSVGMQTNVSVSTLGGIFFYIDGIQYSLNNLTKFSFTVTLQIDNSSYIVNPIFDIRNNKISNNVISDKNLFGQMVSASSNNEHGMLMISNNVRVYMPKSKYITPGFDAEVILNLIEDIYRIYNQLCGLSNNVSTTLIPREQFLLASARSEHVGYGSAGSTMMDTGLESSDFYMVAGWGLFHECGHMFEGWWAVIEIWTNMYSKFMADRTSAFTWLWEADRLGYETSIIQPYFENYLIRNTFYQFGLGTKDGLYFFVSLEQALGANFMSQAELYSRLNSIPNTGFNYVIYSVAKNFGLNAIPYGEIFGQYIYESSIINDIIDNSKATLLYIPENSSFDMYRKISAPVTNKMFYLDNPIINGMSNPNATVTIKLKSNNYYIKTDKNGKFSFNIPIQLTVTDPISICSTELGKEPSPTKVVYVANHLVDSIITFYGLGNAQIATIRFNVNSNKLIVSSTGSQAHSYFGTTEYFGVSFQDSSGNVITDVGVQGVQNANTFATTLNNQTFNYNYVIIIRGQELNRVKVTNYNGQANYNPYKYGEGFKIKDTGLYPQFDYSNNQIVFLGLGNAEIARIKFNLTKNILEVSSTGTQAHFYFGSQVYFSAKLLDKNGNIVVQDGVQGTQNANTFASTLNNQPFGVNYSIALTYQEIPRVIITNYNNQASYNPSGNSSTFVFNAIGLV